jgi:hypothetical protein
MKKYVILISAFLLLTLMLKSQESSASEKEQQTKDLIKSDLDNESSQGLLREKLEEIASEIQQAENRIDAEDAYMDDLELYRKEVYEIKSSTLKTLFEIIGEALVKKDEKRSMLEEKRLRKKLSNLFWLLRNKTKETVNGSDEVLTSGFSGRILDILKDIRSNEVVNNFLAHPDNTPYIKNAVQLDSLRAALSKEKVDDLQADIMIEIHKETERITAKKILLNRELDKFKALKRKLGNKLEESVNIHRLAIILGLPLFCLTIIFLFIGPGYIQARLRSGSSDLLGKSQNVLLDLSTVLLLTMSILILGLSGNINNEVLGTLIGGISGYVLNKNHSANTS